MRTIETSEAQANFLSLLDEVERGESIVITRNGKRVASITPEREFDPERAKQAFENIKALRERTLPMSLDEILSARDEGRR